MNKIVLLIVTVIVAGGMYATRSLVNQEESAPSLPAPRLDDEHQDSQSMNDAVSLQPDQIKIQNHIITVEIADTPEKRMQGLSGRSQLQNSEGMLFVFDRPLTPDFWMKGMNFSIDIIWIDMNGIIVGFEMNIEPSSFPQTFSPPVQVVYVLEVPAGWVSQNNVFEGTLVQGSMIK